MYMYKIQCSQNLRNIMKSNYWNIAITHNEPESWMLTCKQAYPKQWPDNSNPSLHPSNYENAVAKFLPSCQLSLSYILRFCQLQLYHGQQHQQLLNMPEPHQLNFSISNSVCGWQCQAMMIGLGSEIVAISSSPFDEDDHSDNPISPWGSKAIT